MPSPNHNSLPPLWVSESPRQWVVAGSEKDRTENPISNIVNTNIDINIIININVNINNININSISIDLSKWHIFAYLPVPNICRLWSDLGPIKREISSEQRLWSEFTPENRMCKTKNCRQTLFACSPQNVGVCRSYLAGRRNNKQSPSSCPWTYVFSHPPLLTDIAREMRPIVPFLVGEHKHSLFHPILENFPDTDVGLKEI